MPTTSLVIMAAGVGSRYGGLKQIDPMGPNGEIFLDYAVYDAVRAGFDRVVFIIRHEIEEAFREKVGSRIEKQVDTVYAFQDLDDLPDGYRVPEGRTKPWGTGQAVLSVRGLVDGPFAVINADDFYGQGAYAMLRERLSRAKDADGVYDYCMVGYVLRNTLSDHGHVARGVCEIGDDGCLSHIVERTKIEKDGDEARFTEDDGATWHPLSADTTVSMNMWGFTPGFLDELATGFPAFLAERGIEMKSEYLVPTIVGNLLREGRARVEVLPTDERWFGVTYREDVPKVKAAIAELIDRGVYPSPLWGG